MCSPGDEEEAEDKKAAPGGISGETVAGFDRARQMNQSAGGSVFLQRLEASCTYHRSRDATDAHLKSAGEQRLSGEQIFWVSR
jgi:hypothetical protein